MACEFPRALLIAARLLVTAPGQLLGALGPAEQPLEMGC